MGQANRHRKPSATVRRLSVAGAAAAMSVVPLCAAAPASAAPAAPAVPAAEDGRTAVIGPLLDFFGFGATVGAPLVCSTASAGLGSGFQEFGAVEQGNTLVDGIDQGCTLFSEQANVFVEQGKVAQAPYAEQFNPVANPALEQLADAVAGFGASFEPALAPFGPTVAGSGNTLRFLVGSPPAGS